MLDADPKDYDSPFDVETILKTADGATYLHKCGK